MRRNAKTPGNQLVPSEWMFRPDLDSGRVEEVMRDWALPHLDLWAAFPTGRRASAKARAFATFVEDQLKLSKLTAPEPALETPGSDSGINLNRTSFPFTPLCSSPAQRRDRVMSPRLR
jgi:hypothetical protein